MHAGVAAGVGSQRQSRFNGRVEFRILGPLELVEDGRPLRLGSRRQRALLVLLLLRAGEAVSRDRLIDELWHGDPPPAAEVTLRSHLSRLRSAVGASRLSSRPPGYVLVLEPEELDAARFKRLSDDGRRALAQGRVAEAAKLLRAALALWRGPALADFADEPFTREAITQLDESRLVVTEERIEADLALGRHAELVGELEGLVAAHPFRERLCGQLMLALYRSGRQAEALDSYKKARRALAEDLGLEPSEALKALQKAILTHDATLDRPSRVEDDAPTEEGSADGGAAAFVGRHGELRQLRAGLDDALAGRGRLFLISGEPGIGKSRLAEEFAGHARRREALVLVGRCWEAGGAPAFWPFVQALRSCVRDRDPDLLRRQLGSGASELAQLLPELRELFPDLPVAVTSEPEAARFRLFDATASFLRNASDTQPLVFVLDDLHAADTPSLLLLRFIARELAESRVLLLAAYRDVDPTLQGPLSATLAELSRESLTRHLSLSGLREQDVASFIEQITRVVPPKHAVTAIHQATEGNPLFVGEIVRLLVTEGELAEIVSERAWQLTVPEGVKAVIRRRLRHLSGECKLVLDLASVLGREFRIDALAQAAGVEGDVLLDALDGAARERIITDVPGLQGRLRFAHALIRDTLIDELTPGRRAQLHRRVGEALELVYANDAEPQLAELAHHFLAAGPAGPPEKAANYARLAGDQAAALLAYEEAVRLYETALTLSREDAARCELFLVLGDAQARSGETQASKDAYRKAADLAARLGLPQRLAQAALGYGGRFLWDASRDDRYLVPLLEQALAGLGDDDDHLRVRLLARLAAGPLRDASYPPGRRAMLSGDALEAAERIGDPATLSYALAGYVLANDAPDKALERLELSTKLVAIATAAEEKERAVEGHEVRLLSLLETGELDAARTELEAMASLAAALQQPSQRWFVAAYKALLTLLEGRLAEAEELIADAFDLGSHVQEWSAGVSYRLQLYVLRREQGRLEEIQEVVRRSVGDYPTYPIWRCVLAHMTAVLGLTTEARAHLDALASDDFAALPFDEEWLVGMSLLSETVQLLHDAERAAVLYERLLPYANRVGVIYTEISTGSVSRYLGVLASTMSRWEDAESHFEDALAMNRRIGARAQLARTQHDYATMLLQRSERGDADKAQGLLELAKATSRELGMSLGQVPV